MPTYVHPCIFLFFVYPFFSLATYRAITTSQLESLFI